MPRNLVQVELTNGDTTLVTNVVKDTRLKVGHLVRLQGYAEGILWKIKNIYPTRQMGHEDQEFIQLDYCGFSCFPIL